ncbi:MAG: hypothetical protein ACRD15_10075 [Vicinamibacterales bacterium]
MTRRRIWLIAAVVIAAILGAVVRNQVKVYRGRQARAALTRQRHPVVQQPHAVVQQRQALFDMLRPVALTNCELKRFGETHDGGYLMCGNLLGGAGAAYSYGIAGYDKWGCDISTAFNLTAHQYDCFDTTQPACPDGRTVFHAECVGDATRTVEGRIFDTITNQFARNGDGAKQIVLKIDVEGAEWDSLLSVPDRVLEQIDQMAVEFHWIEDETFRWVHDDKYLRVVQRLKQFFEIGHIHYNNASCIGDLEPFPTWAYEVLFVSKRLAVVDRSRKAGGPHPLDAPNDPSRADCQPKGR